VIHYRAIYNSATEPTTKAEGDMWLKPVGSIAYQLYIYLENIWRPLIGGGSYTAETSPDTHYYHIVFDSVVPDFADMNLGWFFYNQATKELFVYNGINLTSVLAI